MTDKLNSTVNGNLRLKELVVAKIEKRALDALKAELGRGLVNKNNVGATFKRMMVMSCVDGPISSANEKQHAQVILS